MGFLPRHIDEMTLWEFSVCVDGWSLSRGVKKPGRALSETEYDALVELGAKWNKEATDG